MYAGMVLLLNRPPSAADLLQASEDAGRSWSPPCGPRRWCPDYFAQVAAHLLEADAALFDGRYAEAIQFGMAGRGILSLQSAGPPPPRQVRPGRRVRPPIAELPLSAFGGAEFGLDRPVVIRVPGQPRRLAALAVDTDGGPLSAAPAEEVASGFLRELLLRQKVATPASQRDPDGPGPLQTHRLVDRGDHLAVERVLFD